MKIRTDFVTNSSSSSYIISYKPYKNDSLTQEQKIINYLVESILNVENNGWNETSTEAVIINEEDATTYFRDRYGYCISFDSDGAVSGDDYVIEKYTRVVSKLIAGEKVIMKIVDDHDDTMQDILHILKHANIGISVIGDDD